MSKIEVRIHRLEPMRVAVASGYGSSPEPIAWEKIIQFAKARGYLERLHEHRFFGFNNPNPSPGSPNYGYEQWMTVPADAAPAAEVEIQEFPGGLYAVSRCTGIENIGQAWVDLVEWREDSPYKLAPNYYQCLEEVLNPQVFICPDGAFNDSQEAYVAVTFDLYLPIIE